MNGESKIPHQIVNHALESKTVGYSVATGTTIMGVALADVQTWLAVISTSAGIILASVLIVKHIIGSLREWKKYKNGE